MTTIGRKHKSLRSVDHRFGCRTTSLTNLSLIERVNHVTVKKGFTLIELLMVIVIISIIVLPINVKSQNALYGIRGSWALTASRLEDKEPQIHEEQKHEENNIKK